MSRLVESIRYENGVFSRLEYHQERLSNSYHTVFGRKCGIKLDKILENRPQPDEGLYKCRVIYEKAVETVEYLPYVPKKVKTFKLVRSDRADYSHKFEDKSLFKKLLEQKEDCDDIIIIKNGLVTDTSYSNLLFSDGQHWYTPEKPLLEGTMRQYLLDKSAIKKLEIQITDLKRFVKIQPINAMLGFDPVGGFTLQTAVIL
jgi:4-amino-4-deoxychorismate lyase